MAYFSDPRRRRCLPMMRKCGGCLAASSAMVSWPPMAKSETKIFYRSLAQASEFIAIYPFRLRIEKPRHLSSSRSQRRSLRIARPNRR